VKYRADIDGLRAVAVLPVVFFHAGVPGPSGGFVGVDVFFVISGFLITTIVAREINDNRFSLFSFYNRRARRILPALTAMITACFVMAWFVLLPQELEDFAASAIAAALFVSNIYFNSQLDYFNQAADFAPLLHTWSLAVEEQFYVFFPPVLMLLAWWKRWTPAGVIALLALASFALAIVFLPLKSEWVFYQIVFRAWELGFGAVMALAAIKPPQSRAIRDVLGAAALLMILIPVFYYDSVTPFPGIAALPPVLGASLLIWIGSQGADSRVKKILSAHPFVWVGLISYSLYLWHWPVFSFLRIELGTVHIPMPLALGGVVLSFALAWLSYRFVERPFRHGLPTDFSTKFVFSSSLASLTAISIAGLALIISGGVPGRLSADALEMASYAKDRNIQRKACFGRRPAQTLCTLGKASNQDEDVEFLFWGDSHADAFMPAMAKAAETAGRYGVFAGHSACPPIHGIRRSFNDKGCAAFNADIWAWLQNRADVRVVILGARWTLAVEGKRYRGEPGNDVEFEWVDNAGDLPDLPDNAAYVEAALTETVKKIIATGRSVVLLGPVPEVGQHVPHIYARKALLGWGPGVSLKRADYTLRAGRTEQIVSAIAAKDDHSAYVALVDWFCDAQTCDIQDAAGHLFYADTQHLSQTGALARLSSPFRDLLQDIGNETAR